MHALEKLDSFEDLILGQVATPPRGDAGEMKLPSGVAVSGPKPIASAPTSESQRPAELRRPEEVSANAASLSSEPEHPGTTDQLDIF